MFHLAALLSTRVGVHAGDRAPRQRRGHAQPARVRAAAGRVARPPGGLRLSRRRSPPTACRDLDDEGARRARRARTSTRIRRRCTAATSCTASSSGATTRGTTSSCRPMRDAPRRLPLRAVSRPDLGDDGAVRRHVGLRAGDDSRRRARASRTLLRAAATRRFRSWRCPTASTRCWRWRRRRASALTRTAYNVARVQPVGGRDPRRRARGVSRTRRSRTRSTQKRQGDRRLVAGGRGRFRGARRTGASSRRTISTAPFSEYLIPTIQQRYHRMSDRDVHD